MFNFCTIESVCKKKNLIVIEPKFKIAVDNSDLMIRGRDFYAVWDEDSKLWVKDEVFVVKKIDEAVWEAYNSIRKKKDIMYVPALMNSPDSGMIDKWHKYVQKQLRDNYHELDNKIVFQNQEPKRSDYVTKKLTYPLHEGEKPAYDEMMSTLYSDEERQKLEWAIGSIISGDSSSIQKFIVLYGDPGTGKSTFLDILTWLFDGYWNVFTAKALGSASNQFALESFKDNPLISIQHDGDLSRIEDNTLLNSIASHEIMEINEKHKAKYAMRFNTMMFMGTNKPVKITDAKSGILRRLIDVYPTGNKVSRKRYDSLKSAIKFELGAIANHALNVYNDLGMHYYDAYVPLKMFAVTNDFYDFMEYYYDSFVDEDYVLLKDAWELYQSYCSMAKVTYPLPMRQMRTEFANYFSDYKSNMFEDGKHLRNVYLGFKKEKFNRVELNLKPKVEERASWLKFNSVNSVFDFVCADCLAQYATKDETPKKRWDDVATKLSDINTSELHYVKVFPINHIVIDFDLKDKDGNKSLEKNIIAASKWPPTYAELSKSGQGIHLHYIYTGDPAQLSNIVDEHIEIKVFSGGSSLRRKLTRCNELQIATISSGLPLRKEKKKVIDSNVFKNEKQLISRIVACLNRVPHADTRSNIDYIKRSLDDAYASEMSYDVSKMRDAVMDFAAGSSNQAPYCMKLVQKMKFKSKDQEDIDLTSDISFKEDAPIAFYDVEVFPNLLLINWKFQTDKKCKRMINPTPLEVASLFKYRLIGFNNLRYDNAILMARAQGGSNETIYNISKHLIKGGKANTSAILSKNVKNLSYADLYDIAAKKQSLKKWEIELHIHHKELGFNWDEPVPEEKWEEVAAYCDNDVFATEALFNHIQGDFKARQMLAIISGLTVNTPDNSHSAKIIFGDDKNHKSEFVYTDLTQEFPEYKFENGKSTYRGEEVGEGGAVRATPGMYDDIWVFDIVSMHPHSAYALNIFGDKYTKKFYSLVELRVAIKHGDTEKVATMFDGKLKPYLDDKSNLKAIAQALKIVINSVYGLTSAHFDNPFRDPRNVDNIVAKRGALFILSLKYELEKKGIQVIHVKTDSIKVPSPTEETKKFIFEYAKKYGYEFEIEHIYDKFCLVNDAVYIGKFKEPIVDDDGHETWWDATGKEFQRPYVYKTLFSHEPLEPYDMCETRSVQTAIYLDMNEELPEGEHNYVFIGKVGLFAPVVNGGGIMVRESQDKEGNVKYTSVNDSKGYRWLEVPEDISKAFIDNIDKSYYTALADDARKHIEEFGDFEIFTA